MNIENFGSEEKQNVQELFVLLNLPKNDALNINNTNELFNYFIEKQKFICINKPKNQYEEVNLFDTILGNRAKTYLSILTNRIFVMIVGNGNSRNAKFIL